VAIAPEFTIGFVMPPVLRSTADSELNGNPVAFEPMDLIGSEVLTYEREDERLGHAHDRERHPCVADFEDRAAGADHADAELIRVGPFERGIHGGGGAIGDGQEAAIGVVDQFLNSFASWQSARGDVPVPAIRSRFGAGFGLAAVVVADHDPTIARRESVTPSQALGCCAETPREVPAMSGKNEQELKSTGYEIFVGILSILSIVNLVLIYVFTDPNLDTVLRVMNALLSAIFLGDFTYRLVTSTPKSKYLFRQFGWADLLASLPFHQLKVLRIFRLIRVFRLLREHGVKKIVRSLVKDRAGSALLTLLLMGILVLEFGSLVVLHIEQYARGANITTGADAVWYVLVTISTVGYGDRFPVTNSGRVAGAVIIMIGVGIFGTFTGYLANVFLTPSAPQAAPQPLAPVNDSERRIEQLRTLVAEQRAALDEIEALLAAGE
jgi:Ion transport protein